MDAPPTRVLLVDDEEDLTRFMAKRLRRKGIDVASCASGPAALRLSREQPFDVVVLDLKMPEMDGLEALRRLKAAHPNCQVIMLTGHGSFDTALESGRHDAFRFLTKPTPFEELLEVIREAAAEGRRRLRQAFDAEMDKLIAETSDPRDLLNETKRLREKYGQNRE